MNAHNTLNTNIISPIDLIESDVQLSKVILKYEMSSTPYSDMIIVFVNSNNEYQGIVHPLDLLSKQLNINISAKNIISKNVPILRNNDLELNDWVAIAQLLINGSTRQIVILDSKNHVLGLIKDIDLFRIIPEDEKYLNTSIESIMSPILDESVFSDVSVGNAISVMKKHNLSHIVVINKQTQKINGIINSKTLLTHLYPRGEGDRDKFKVTKWTGLPVSNFVQETKIFSSKTTFASVMKYMIENSTNFCIIEDQKMFFLVNAIDILQYLLTFFQKDEFHIIVKDAPDESIKLQTIRNAQSIIKRYTNLLGPTITLKIKFKAHKSQAEGGRYSTTVEVHLETIENESFSAEANEFGAEKAVNAAMDRLMGILSEKRTRALDKIARGPRKP
ncbi:MAG: CBS domain-containing protein [Candidatus Hodarchaeales archaeon]|jgi:predicted transcriptional regulator